MANSRGSHCWDMYQYYDFWYFVSELKRQWCEHGHLNLQNPSLFVCAESRKRTSHGVARHYNTNFLFLLCFIRQMSPETVYEQIKRRKFMGQFSQQLSLKYVTTRYNARDRSSRISHSDKLEMTLDWRRPEHGINELSWLRHPPEHNRSGLGDKIPP